MRNRKSALKDWLIVILSLLDDAVVLAAVIIILRYFKVDITLPVIIVIAVLFIGFVILMHRAVVPALHRKKISGAEGMIGLDGKVAIDMTLTAPGCPVAGTLPTSVAEAAASVEGVGEVEVRLVWDPPWTPAKMSDDAKMALDIA